MKLPYPECVEKIVAIGAGTLQKNFFPDKMSLEDLKKFDAEFIAEQKKIRPEPERWQEFCDKYIKFWHEMAIGEETFSRIKCPVLLIVGDEDDHTPVIKFASVRNSQGVAFRFYRQLRIDGGGDFSVYKFFAEKFDSKQKS